MTKAPGIAAFALLLLAAAFGASPASERDSPRRGFALVLSGGGARGIAQIGVFRAFEEAGLKPDLIVATSMGAIIGGLYAAGYSADSIAALARDSDWESFFSNQAERKSQWVSQKAEPANYLLEMRFDKDLTPVLPNAISHGQAIFSALSPLLAAPLFRASLQFDSLDIPLRIVSTDLVSGKSVVFSSGDLITAIRASCGIPLAFSPVSRESMLLLDGGLTANIPSGFAAEENADVIVAVDVTSPMMKATQLANPINFVNQIVAIGVERRKKADRALSDVLIQPSLEGFVYTHFDDIDTIIERGYVAAKEMIPRIKEKLSTRAAADSSDTVVLPIAWRIEPPLTREYCDSLTRAILNGADRSSGALLQSALRDSLVALGYSFATVKVSAHSSTRITVELGRVRDIFVSGNRTTSRKLILAATEIEPGVILTNRMIKRTISFLYATGLFNTVNVHVDSGPSVHIEVTEKEYWRTRFGLRFDDFHLGEGYIQPAYENLFGWGVCALAHLQYGLRREKYSLELQGGRLFTARLANDLRLQFYISSEKIAQITRTPLPGDTTGSEILEQYDQLTLRKAGVLASAGTQIGRIAMLGAGVRIERFRITSSNHGQFEDAFGMQGGLLGAYKLGIRHAFLRLIIDDLDRFPFPQNGQKHYITVGGASDAIGGTESFLKVNGNLRYYRTIAHRHTISPMIWLTWADTRLPAVERVFLGGAFPEEKYRDQSVYSLIPFSGLPPLALPGDLLILANLTYRFAIQKRFFATALIDWGYTWDYEEPEADRNYLHELLRDAPIGIGLGMAYESRFGPLSVSWGRLLRGGDRLRDKTGISEQNIIYFSAGYDF